MSCYRFLAPVAAVGLALSSAGPAAAAAPQHFGPFTNSGSVTVDCGGFDASISYTEIRRSIRYTDSAGHVTAIKRFTSAPDDTWINLSTGKTIHVRGNFVQTLDFTTGSVTITGYRYLVTEPGTGVTVQEVGRIVYTDETEQEILNEAGQHNVTSEEEIGSAFCGALAAP